MKRLNQTMLPLIAASLISANPVWAADQTSGKPASPTPTEQTKQLQELSPAKESNAAATSVKQENTFTSEVKKSLELLYEAIPALKELRLENQNYEETSRFEFSGPIWSLEFTNRPQTGDLLDRSSDVSASVELDAKTGRLLWLDIRHPDWASGDFPADQLAREQADAFIQKIFGPVVSKNLKQSPSLGRGKATSGNSNGEMEWARKSVSYNPIIHGIPLQSGDVSVSVDAAGHVIRYEGYGYVDESSADWPDPSSALSLEEARSIAWDNLEMNLVYDSETVLKYDQHGKAAETKPMLIYEANLSDLDALTGKPLYEMEPIKREVIKVQGQGQGVPTLASKEEVEAWLKKKFGIDVAGAAFYPDDHSLLLGEDMKTYRWRHKAGKDTVPPFQSVSVHTNKNGQLMDFSLFLSSKRDASKRDASKQLTLEQAKQKAMDALEPHLDPSLAAVELITVPEEEIPAWVDKSKLEPDIVTDYDFQFTVKRNGVEVRDESYQVGIDKLTGVVTNFSLHPIKSGVSLPSPDNLVSAKQAKEAYKNAIDLELVYIWEDYEGQKAPEPKLVYQRKSGTPSSFVDATTGKLVIVERPH
ncbi:YcdB/YcdC domain-containing protein [Brevibacillus migulae]|uniref:YcdB/YcdC domain-containing protein n=1 Tax=Brevibacillus migulae TaxID=1644114 RepID=UPI00106EDC33|nr:YcdB/YcdC domain-containing protein [Brevibacillus migulae]